MSLLITNKSSLIGVLEITEPWQDLLRKFQHKPPGIDEIKSDKRKQEWLSVRLLLQQIIGADAYIIYKENGTPVLNNSKYNISISHTTGYAAIILSENLNPGIDIEYHSERAWKLREKFLSEKELEIFSGEQSLIFHRKATLCWCAKETAFKALQQTSVDFIEHLNIEPFIISDKGVLKLKENKTPQQQTFYINYQINENYIIAWKE